MAEPCIAYTETGIRGLVVSKTCSRRPIPPRLSRISRAHHKKKALFTSPPRSSHAGDQEWLGLDLRAVSELLPDHSEFDATCAANPHKVELKPFDLSWHGHRGPGIECEMEMKEGQAIAYILRIAPELAKKEDEAHRASTRHPTKDVAEELGVTIEKLVAAKSHLQPDVDPVITPVRIFMLASALHN